MTLDEVKSIAKDIGVDVMCSRYGGMFHVMARVDASDKCPIDEVGERCSKLLYKLADGKIAYIRQPPTVESFKDFERGAMVVYGYTRFSFSENSGDWIYTSGDQSIKYVGFGAYNATENDQSREKE